jgi:hypothetical protein
VSSHIPTRPDVTEPNVSRLRGVVQSTMWRWLFEAYRLLGIHLEIIDDNGQLVTPPSSASAELRNAVIAHRNVEAFLTHETRASIVLAGMSVSSTPIVSERAVAGAVLIAVGVSDALDETHLARVGSALAKAIAEQLSQSAHDRLDSLHKISALYQLLHASVAIGSESAVLRTFAEALSIWEDLEIFAYRADLRRRYTLEVTLPGSNVSAVPRVLDQFADPDRLAVSVLSAGEGVSEDLGVGADASSVHLSTAGGSWLIATRSTRQGGPVTLSELYFAALAHALNAAVAVEASRLTWAVMQQFVAGESAAKAAARALTEVSSVLRAEGYFLVLAADGATVLTAGTPAAGAAERSPLTDGATLRTMIDVPAPFSAILEMRASGDHVFTERDVKLFDSARDTFDTWLPPALRQLRAGAERRGVGSSFDEVLDRYARDAYASRDLASFILIGGRDVPVGPQTTQRWIRRLRPELRPTDLAGRLRSGEVGILLLQTPSDGAQVVAERLARLFQSSAAPDEPPVRVGVASQMATVVTADALIECARRQTASNGASEG